MSCLQGPNNNLQQAEWDQSFSTGQLDAFCGCDGSLRVTNDPARGSQWRQNWWLFPIAKIVLLPHTLGVQVNLGKLQVENKCLRKVMLS